MDRMQTRTAFSTLILSLGLLGGSMATTHADPRIIYGVFWRGCEEVCEGFSDYQRVLDSQQALFRQQQRLVTLRGDSALSLVALYRALGGGWESRGTEPLISDQSREQMLQRTDWGELLEEGRPAGAGGPEDGR